jgi:hypothetical protein
LDVIKSAMLRRGEYGEFFPLSFSPFPYNGSLANLSHTMSKEEVEKKGAWWYESPASDFGGKVINVESIKKISEITDEMLQGAFVGAKDNRPFRVTPEELRFYRGHNLLLPDAHPETRIKNRFVWLNYMNLDDVVCKKCGVNFLSSLPKNFQQNLLCPECYNAEMI